MKPQTLGVMTNLSIEEIKGNLKQIVDDLDNIDASGCRNIATDCHTIAEIAEALENIFLTAADEADRIEAAAAEMTSAGMA